MSAVQTKIEPYLFFAGRCEEALEFYRTSLGATIGMKMRFGESPESPPAGSVPDDWDDKIMHSSFWIGGSMVMASDGCDSTGAFQGFSLSLNVTNAEEACRLFDALADGGTITMPLGPTFWSPCFGSVTDRFGVSWMVGVPGEIPA